MNDKTMRIIEIYPDDDRVRVSVQQPALEREWMENTNKKFAYRCLPLNIANQHGWAVYPNKDITVVWNGKDDLDAVTAIEDENQISSSAFGHGILTFHLPFLVRTSDNYNLYITGAPNHPIDNAYALTGIYESDWAPYSFTMNWQITRINEKVTFTTEDPICFFFPVERDLVEDFELVTEQFDDQEDYFREQYYTFVMSRQRFLDGEMPDKEWQKKLFSRQNARR